MDLRYEEYCFGDPLFYDRHPHSDHAGDSISWHLTTIPGEWVASARGDWYVLCPNGIDLAEQGWKIHVSAGLGNAERVLRVTYDYCLEKRIPFKFLRTRKIVHVRNSKYAPRQASGKLVTIYPASDAELERTLADLDTLLTGEPGPYILSDLRYGAGPLYLRYGAFVEQWTTAENGERIPAMRHPDGRLVPDERRPTFHVPDWVIIPRFLAPHLAARKQGNGGEFGYRVRGALHFSNGGGVYLADRKSDGVPVVLKEARPMAGLDADELDAVCRLDREWDTLRRLAGIPGIPAGYDRFTSWEHHFIAMEYLPGRPVGQWLATNYPLGHGEPTEDEIAGYTRRALRILGEAERIIDAIHGHGMVFGDLHNRNLLVDEDGDDLKVSLVDFELAFDVDRPQRPALGAPGFAAPADRTGFAVDDYALAALKLWLFLPLNQILTLAPGKVLRYVDDIEDRFPLPDGYADGIRAALRSDRHPPADTVLDKPEPDWTEVRESIVDGIRRGATPDRPDRLFPGDIETFAVGGAAFGCGAAGVLYTLDRTGAGRFAEYERWLLDSVRRDPPRRPGFLDGAHGIAHVLDGFGHHDEADRLIENAAARVADLTDHGLHGGLAGIGLNLLHLGVSRADPALRQRAADIGERLVSALAVVPEPGPKARAGLAKGWSGPALLFVRLAEATGEPGWLAEADRALRRDLAECVERPDGSLHVRDGGLRTLPYLDVGSAGIAVVAEQLATHRPDAASVAALPGLYRALVGEFAIQSGLMAGRAGLIATLASALRHRDDPDLRRALDRHLSRLSWHSVPYQGQVAFPGNELRKLSMDLATGSAGVLAAIAYATGDTPTVLPFLTDRMPGPHDPRPTRPVDPSE